MQPPEAREAALALVRLGHNDCEIARRVEVPRSTVRDWRRPRYVPRSMTKTCPRCWRPTKTLRCVGDDYAKLFGLYLGDGWISGGVRSYRLRIALDARYPHILAEVNRLVTRCCPGSQVGEVPAEHGRIIVVRSIQATCRVCSHRTAQAQKHCRAISLEP